jgi:hypothetical protein
LLQLVKAMFGAANRQRVEVHLMTTVEVFGFFRSVPGFPDLPFVLAPAACPVFCLGCAKEA